MKSLFYFCLFVVLLRSNEVFSQFEEEEDTLTTYIETNKLNYKPSVYLRVGLFHGFGSPEVFNQVPLSRGIGASIYNQRFSFGLEMDFFNFKNNVDNVIQKDRVYHLKGMINFNVLDHFNHILYVGASFGRIEPFRAIYDEFEPDLSIYNSQRYWVASPVLSYYRLMPFFSNSKWMFKIGGFVSYSIPLQGYYPDYTLEKLPERELWLVDGALQFGVNIGVTQMSF